MACDSGRRIEDNLGAVQPERSCALRKMPVIANVNTNIRISSLEDRITKIAGFEIEFLPKTRMAMRNMCLAIFAEIFSVGVDHGCGVVIDSGYLFLVDLNDNNH